MNILKHIVGQPFVFATGTAALVHSTWALGTLFAGEQPEGWHLIGWLVPALLIAFALDVGQIATSAEIRRHGLNVSRAVTFVVFALATYYLQWLYAAHHMPLLELAPGVRESWAETATVMRDAAVWIIPALLPLSTLLYTFSGGRDEHSAPEVPAATVEHPALLQVEEVLPALELKPVATYIECDACEWHGEYTDIKRAAQALRAHQKHCTGTSTRIPEIETYTNGKGH